MAPRKKGFELPAGRLWPNTPSGNPLAIEVFGATGEYKSGKTLLGLSIAPGVHPAGHPFAGKPRTLLLDFEKSAGTYGGTGCERIDVPTEMLAKHQGKYGPKQVFEWFQGRIDSTQPGQYDVIMADPITDIESGLLEYVKTNCQQFGLTPDQMRKAGGLLWGAVKDYWKLVLLKLSSRCQCFYFTSHLRDEWKGDRPSGKRQPKGKETLMELASLYLWLDRSPSKEGSVPAVPSALVFKERLADTRINADGQLEIVLLLPPRLEQATVDEIRRYIANPPNYSRLLPKERVPDQEFTPEEKLRLELARAEAERETETSRLALLERRAQLQAAQIAAQEKAGEEGGKRKRNQPDRDQPARQEVIDRLKAEAEGELKTAKEMEKTLTETRGGPVVAIQPPSQGEIQKADDVPPPPTAPGKATRTQAMEIERLFHAVGFDEAKQQSLLQRAKAATPADLSRELAHALIEKLTKLATAKSGTNSGN